MKHLLPTAEARLKMAMKSIRTPFFGNVTTQLESYARDAPTAVYSRLW
jgi:hypothetical protein